MNRAPWWRRGYRRVFRLSDAYREIEEELEFHIAMKAAELEETGMDAGEARAEARRSFGELPRIRRACRALHREMARRRSRGELLDSIRKDLGYGLRSLARTPGLSLVAVLTLAIGIGATTAAWSVVDRVLLRLPVSDPDRVVQLMEVWRDGSVYYNAPRNVEDWAQQTSLFERLAALYADDRAPVLLERQDRRVILPAIFASSDLLPILGMEPALGRNFLPEEDRLGAPPVVLVSDAFWKEELDGAPDVLGRVVRFSTENWPDLPEEMRPPGYQPGYQTRAFTVVGVLPPGFELPPLRTGNGQSHGALGRSRMLSSGLFVERPDVLLPFGLFTRSRDSRGFSQVRALGMLAEGVTLERAQERMDRLAAAIDGPERVRLTPIRSLQREVYGDRLTMLALAAAFLLLTACANVAALLLARGARRERECAVRVALGAGRRRLVRQLLTETALLAVAGCVGGVALAGTVTLVLASLAPGAGPLEPGALLDLRVLTAALGVTVASLLLAGLVPALHAARPDIHRSLGSGTSTPSTSRRRLLRWISVAQLATSTVLLVGTGLLVRSLERVSRVDPGLRVEDVLTVRLEMLPRAASGYPTRAESTAVLAEIVERVRALPEVTGVARTSTSFARPSDYVVSYSIVAGNGEAPAEIPGVREHAVTPGYFSLLDIPILAGRDFTAEDQAARRTGTRFPVIISESMARRYWPDSEAVGRSIRWGRPDMGEPAQPIVGVVRDVRFPAPETEARNELYDVSSGGFWGAPPRIHLLIRTRTDPSLHLRSVRDAIAAVDPDEPNVTELATLAEVREAAMAPRRYELLLAAMASATALLLGWLGLFGVMSHSVARRTKEIGLRRALGAGRDTVMASVLREAVRLNVVGLGIGLVGAAVLARLMESQLFGVTILDPPTYVTVALTLFLVAGLAAWVPARRAVGLDPVSALRTD